MNCLLLLLFWHAAGFARSVKPLFCTRELICQGLCNNRQGQFDIEIFMDMLKYLTCINHFCILFWSLCLVLYLLSCACFLFLCLSFCYKQLEKIPLDEIKKELRAAELSEQAVEELLQILTVKSLEELEGSMLTW